MLSSRVEAVLKLELELNDDERHELAVARGKYVPVRLAREQVLKARQLLRALAEAAEWKREQPVYVVPAATARDLRFSEDELRSLLDYGEAQGWFAGELVFSCVDYGPSYGLSVEGLWTARKVRGGGLFDHERKD